MAKVRKNPARFDHENHEIILYKWFAEKSKNPRNPEFKMLISYTTSFPTYEIVIRDDIEVNSTQEHYNGLTYEYMKWYIGKYEQKETREKVLSELESRIDISKCHSKGRRYPAIKKWFAELELRIIRERVRSGVANARAKGVKLGRPQTTAEQIPQIFYRHYPSFKSGSLNLSEFARVCGLSRTTVYKYVGLLENK